MAFEETDLDATAACNDNVPQTLTKVDIESAVTSAVNSQVSKLVSSLSPIPCEQERPRFVVLDDAYTAADGAKHRAGVWHFGVKAGRGDSPPTLEQHWICSPLHVDALTHDSAENNFGRLLRFTNALGKWRQWAMPMEVLKGDGADLRGALLSMGVQLEPSHAGRNKLATYLQSQVPPSAWKPCCKRAGPAGTAKPLPCLIPSLAQRPAA